MNTNALVGATVIIGFVLIMSLSLKVELNRELQLPCPTNKWMGQFKQQDKIVIYGATWCSACHDAAELLTQKNISFTIIYVDKQPNERRHMKAGVHTIPQIFINGKYIGGTQELKEYLNDR